jgi:nucleotide-binding universal stress UspA family protein
MTDRPAQARTSNPVHPADLLGGRPEIVVGYDESAESAAALEWATARARAMGADLRVVYAADPPVPLPWTTGAVHPANTIVLHSAAKVARRAADQVRREVPSVRVRSEGVVGSPAAELIVRSEGAAFVVVGRGRHGRLAEMGSVSFALASHGRCPVVVVRGDPSRAIGPGRPVVVGVDSSRSSRRALSFASLIASRSGAELVVVSAWLNPEREAWMGQLWADPGRAADLVASASERATAAVTEAIAQVHDEHPDLVVVGRTPVGRPQEALLEDRQAGLVVVGSRGRGGFPGLMLGSVSRVILRQAVVPVAIARDGTS